MLFPETTKFFRKKKSDYSRFLRKIGNFVADLYDYGIYGTEIGIEGADPGGL